MAREDDENFTCIFNAHYAGLCRFLEGMTGGRSAAQDLAQDCFLRFYRAEQMPSEEARFWLYRVARNLALNELKRRNVRVRLIEKAFGVFRPTILTPEEQYQADEQSAHLRKMLESLPEHQRAALLLRENEEMTYSEIARVLCASESKIKIDIFRARQTLRTQLSKAEQVEEIIDNRIKSSC